jgi:ABC-type transport system substrate-binding protein
MAMVHARTDLLPVMNAYVENLRALGVDASFDIIDDPQLQERASPPNFDFDALPTTVVNGGLEPGGVLKQAWASVARDNSSRNRMGYADPAVDRLLDKAEAATSREELTTAIRALDRVLRSQFVIVPRYLQAGQLGGLLQHVRAPRDRAALCTGRAFDLVVQRRKGRSAEGQGRAVKNKNGQGLWAPISFGGCFW